MKVKVYWNLHKKCYSVQHKGIVIDHLERVILENAEFKVSESGRQRVLKQKRKNVHAFVVGELANGKNITAPHYVETVRYNPYQNSTFVNIRTNQPIKNANLVELYKLGQKPIIDAYEKVFQNG